MNLIKPSVADLTAVVPTLPGRVPASTKPGMSAGMVIGVIVVTGLAAFGMYTLITETFSRIQDNLLKKQYHEQQATN